MISSVSNASGVTAAAGQLAAGAAVVDAVVDLEAIRLARGDVNEMRMLLKGSKQTCYTLFRKAVEEGDVIVQIQLSHALFGMRWGNDESKDFSSLHASKLEVYSALAYYPRRCDLFNGLYDLAIGQELDLKKREARGEAAFCLAASRGYLPAFLELKCKEWERRATSYGFAVQLQPHVGKGDRCLDFYFGRALKDGSQIGSKLYYEGLYWMEQSLGIPVKYPEEGESFEAFTTRSLESPPLCGEEYRDYDGFRHVGGETILAPSREAWERFVKEKLGDVRCAPAESYVFKYDAKQIQSLLEEHNITSLASTETRDGSRSQFVSIFQNGESMGVVLVKEDSFQISETFKKETIQPIIDFIENVMIRTGSSQSAHDWLTQIRLKGN